MKTAATCYDRSLLESPFIRGKLCVPYQERTTSILLALNRYPEYAVCIQ